MLRHRMCITAYQLATGKIKGQGNRFERSDRLFHLYQSIEPGITTDTRPQENTIQLVDVPPTPINTGKFAAADIAPGGQIITDERECLGRPPSRSQVVDDDVCALFDRINETVDAFRIDNA